MRIWILVLPLLLTAYGTAVSAQTFQGSALAGANISQIDGDDLLGFHQPGVNAGLRVVALLGDRWRLGPEILYSQQGARRSNNSINFSEFEDIRFNALEVPLMLYYKDWRLTAEAGVSFQRVFNSRVINNQGEDVTDQYPIKDNLFAFKVGATIYLTEHWGLNVRWSKHVADINSENVLGGDFRGRTVSLRAVYTFGQGVSLPRSPRTPTEDQR